LKRFPAWQQRLTMESCGKSVTGSGARVTYEGEPGTSGQHSLYQLIHQGTRLIPCDLIGFCRTLNPPANHHDLLMASVFAQSQALAFGKPAPPKQPCGELEGNGKSNTILAERLTPSVLGRLIALYEHGVFTQAAIWDINAFDQFGVEPGKVLAREILPVLDPNGPPPSGDSSTVELIRRYRNR
jgi:glucose-6-phosphate isomerase